MIEDFAKIVTQAFSFMEVAGFKVEMIDSTQVLYKSDDAFLVVSWDPRSGELDAFVGLLPRTGLARDEYSIADVMGASGAPEADCKLAQVTDPRKLGPFVDQLAVHLRTHGQRALVGDQAYFKSLEVFRAVKAERDMLAMRLRQVRSQAEQAWQDQQYDRVDELYSSVKEELTQSERRKLEYARIRRS